MPLDGNTLLPTASRKETSVDVCALCQDDVLHAVSKGGLSSSSS